MRWEPYDPFVEYGRPRKQDDGVWRFGLKESYPVAEGAVAPPVARSLEDMTPDERAAIFARYGEPSRATRRRLAAADARDREGEDRRRQAAAVSLEARKADARARAGGR